MQQATRQLKAEWQTQTSFKRLGKDAAQLSLDALDGLAAAGDTLLIDNADLSHLRPQTEADSMDETTLRRRWQRSVADCLTGHDANLIAFVQDRLAEEWNQRFQEILQDPGDLGTRADRACRQLRDRVSPKPGRHQR